MERMTNTYSEYSLYRFLEIRLYKYICKIPGCCDSQHSYHICAFHWYTRLYLGQQSERE